MTISTNETKLLSLGGGHTDAQTQKHAHCGKAISRNPACTGCSWYMTNFNHDIILILLIYIKTHCSES